MVLLAKALSGGHVPVGAVLMRKPIFDKVFNRMDRAVVHGSTFAKNDLAMAAGIATLDVIDAGAADRERGAHGRAAACAAFGAMAPHYEMLSDVRGKGLMIGVEFGAPKSFRLKASWSLLETGQQGTVLPAHHHPAVQGPQDPLPGRGPCAATPSSCCRRWSSPTRTATGSCDAFDAVIAGSHRVPGAVWSLGKTLVSHAAKARMAG